MIIWNLVRKFSLRNMALGGILILMITGCGNAQFLSNELPLLGNKLDLSWTYDSGSAINHPLIVAGGMIIFVPQNGNLTALDAKSGKINWELDLPQKVWERSYTSDGNRIFVGLEGGTISAIDVYSGKVLWTKNLGINVQVPALVMDDILYVPTTFVGPDLVFDPSKKAMLFALRAKDGKELWSFQTDNYILQTPTSHNGHLYIAGSFYSPVEIEEGGHTRIYAISNVDGTEEWQYESEDGFPKKIHATDSTVNFLGYQDYINGLDAQNGNLLWRKDTGNWVPTFYGFDEIIYFGSANTIVVAIDANTGDTLWKYNIPEGTFNYLMGSPVRVLDDLYFLTQHGDIVGLSALDGSFLWTINSEVTPRIGLTVASGRLFFGDIDGKIYAYSTDDG